MYYHTLKRDISMLKKRNRVIGRLIDLKRNLDKKLYIGCLRDMYFL